HRRSHSAYHNPQNHIQPITTLRITFSLSQPSESHSTYHNPQNHIQPITTLRITFSLSQPSESHSTYHNPKPLVSQPPFPAHLVRRVSLFFCFPSSPITVQSSSICPLSGS